MESSISGSSNRAQAPVSHCLVDGCNADLSQCRDYHRRHKVCEIHSKSPKVTIGGRELRFCQQCSRFHSVVEFDEGKRSCRKRLDGHNRRRRKPQPDSLSRNSRMISNQQGTRLLSFNNAPIFPSAIVSSTWAGPVQAERQTMLYNSHSPLNCIISRDNPIPPEPSTHSYKGVNQFQILQGPKNTLPESSACQSLSNSASTNRNNSSQRMFSDGLNRVIDSDHRALSLLSSAPAVNREIGFSHVVQSDPNPPRPQSLFNNLHFSDIGQYAFTQETESNPAVSATDSGNSSSTVTLHYQGMFQNELDGSSASESHQTLTFRWD